MDEVGDTGDEGEHEATDVLESVDSTNASSPLHQYDCEGTSSWESVKTMPVTVAKTCQTLDVVPRSSSRSYPGFFGWRFLKPPVTFKLPSSSDSSLSSSPAKVCSNGFVSTASYLSSVSTSIPVSNVRLSLGNGPDHLVSDLRSHQLLVQHRGRRLTDGDVSYSRTEDLLFEDFTPISDGVISSAGDARSFPPVYTEVALEDLEDSSRELRRQILSVLVECDILMAVEAADIEKCPRSYRDYPETIMSEDGTQKNNYLWLPEGVLLDSCFMDYLNLRCADAEVLKKILLGPIHVTLSDVDAFSSVLSADCLVRDVILGGGSYGHFYSFCLNRAVFARDTQHCSRCRRCFDWRYWHCRACNRCAYGLSLGKCEHCGHLEVQTLPAPPPPSIMIMDEGYFIGCTSAQQSSFPVDTNAMFGYATSVDNISDLFDSSSSSKDASLLSDPCATTTSSASLHEVLPNYGCSSAER